MLRVQITTIVEKITIAEYEIPVLAVFIGFQGLPEVKLVLGSSMQEMF